MIKIYGASDDLIEIEGDITDEFGAYSPVTFVFSNGTHVRALYCPDGYPGWKLDILKAGTGEHLHAPCPPDDEDNYTDVLELSSKIEWVECWGEYPPGQDELIEAIERVVEGMNIQASSSEKLLKAYRLLVRD